MKSKLLYILIAISIMLCRPVAAQPPENMNEYIEIYPQELLKNKGILYMPLETLNTTPTIKLRILDENGNPSGKISFGANQYTYTDLRGQSTPQNILFPVPFEVVNQTDKYYILSTTPSGQALNERGRAMYIGTEAVYVAKDEARLLGFQYISCEQLVAFYKANPAFIQSMVAADIKPAAYADDESVNTVRELQYYILREQPNEQSGFIPIIMPSVGASMNNRDVTIESKTGDWFKINLKISFIYNGSSDPRVCARSGFHQSYQGYWKAPLAPNGFPYLLLQMNKNNNWKTIAEELGIKN